MIGVQQTNFSHELLLNPNSHFAYLLGFLWSDGHLKKNEDSLTLEIVKKDLDIIRPCLESTGHWIFRRPRTRLGRQETQTAYNGDRPFIQFLRLHDFEEKSRASPSKIIKFLKPHLLREFLCGYLDGDGSISFTKPSSGFCAFSVSFWSGYHQDWSWLETICHSEGFHYHLGKRTRPTGQSSSLTLNGKFAKTFLDFIYSANYPFSLTRKRSKYLSYLDYNAVPAGSKHKYIIS